MPSALRSCLSARERSRQPEPWEHAVVEAGEGADPVAGEGEDEQAGPVADVGGGAKVGFERRLTVGSRRHEVNPLVRVEDAGEEAGHDVAALVFEGNRWHGDVDIVGEQGDQRVEILALVGRRLSALQAGAGPFEGAVDRLDGRVEHVGHLVGVESEDVAQDEHGELARRQDLKRGHEGQGDGFGLLVAGLGPERHVDRPLQEGVGIWLEPYKFAEPGRLGRFNLGHVPPPGGASAGRAPRVEAPVGGDPVEPGADRGAALEPSEALPGSQQRVLEGVLGVLEGSEHPVTVHLELPTVRLGQRPERLAVPGPRPADQLGCHQLHPRRTPLALLVDLTVSTPTGSQTGRSVPAQFLDVVVSASSTAQTIRRRRVGPPGHRKEPPMMLQDKVAVIYGAGGAIGSAVARAYASEGAKLFLTGRHLASVEVVAKDIVSAGGSAEAAEVDALDEQAVDKHLQSVTDKAGRVDISFNAIGIPNPRIRVPLVELDVEQFSQPIATYTRSYFVTARLAARRMVANRSGVIMTVTAVPSRTGIPFVGGGGPAMAAVEALTRGLSAELAPQGIRVVGLRPQGIPETGRIKESFELYAKASGMTWEQFHEVTAGRTHTRRLSTLAELANVAVFMASDQASGMTGTIVNLSMGSLDD